MRPRIYADFHGWVGSPRDPACKAIALDTWGSLRDLSNAGVRLRDGVKLVIHMDSDENEDIEADAVAYYDRASDLWCAELESEIRDVPAYDRSVEQFLCVGCRANLGPETRTRYVQCLHCGESIQAALAAPP